MQAKKKAVVVTVTGAAGNIAYSLLWMIGQGRLLGDDQPVELRLLDIPAMEKAVSGVIMELADSAFPIVSKLVGTSDYQTAFSGVDVALLVGAKPRGPGMQRKDLLSANGAIFAGQGKALNQWANRNVKVVVVGNPANTNALIAAENAPDLPKSAFTAMTRLDQNRAQAQIAARLALPVSSVKNVIIWGNHSKTQYPDVNHAVIANSLGPASVSPLRAAVNDNRWLDGEFISTVQDRGAAIIAARSKSSAASAASACVDHVHDWWLGTKPGEMVSMGVYSDGSAYGVPAGLVFSFPCQCRGGKWEIVKGLKVDSESQKRLDVTTKELQEEKKEGLGH
jgi:malate dehydrogenase